ncbi:hypothetical protein BaRGS_00000255, partial [Batillaria attramentaria]
CSLDPGLMEDYRFTPSKTSFASLVTQTSSMNKTMISALPARQVSLNLTDAVARFPRSLSTLPTVNLPGFLAAKSRRQFAVYTLISKVATCISLQRKSSQYQEN